MFTFTDIDNLRQAKLDADAAIQTGPAAGLWTRCSRPRSRETGGSVVRDLAGAWWERACDPSRLEARWFGIVADGQHDDAPALQRAIDSLPPEGGVLLLPTGRMRCGSSLRISRQYITIEGANCGLRSKYFEPGHDIGQGSLLVLDQGVDGILIQAADQTDGVLLPRLGGITLRNFGIAGAGRQAGQTGIVSRPAEGRNSGSTDALLLERLYVIDCTWSAYLNSSDAGIINQCWFSECANGLHLEHCIYTVLIAPCFADNDHVGMWVHGGKSNEVVAGVFVRNERALILRDTQRGRVTGGVFDTDRHGGTRRDVALIDVEGESQVIVTGASFYVDGANIPTAIRRSGSAVVEHVACQISGELKQLVL